MWSHEISASTGQFTQQVLQQNAYARQINPFDNRSQAEALSGNLINRGVGFAAPIAKFVGGLAGLDSPLSGAMTWGGIGAMAGGPLGAGIGAGLGAVAGTAGAVAQFGVGNFMTGMQQQQGLNQMLRQNYGFMRPGGYGFTGADMGMIGSQIRSMSHQAGPGGEMHSFAELSQLASNMGRMGFSQNITDVRQFTQKFRQMVDTLKTVSKELGTSLQAAQEMVVGMRQSGIFNTADQIKMAQGIRANNLAGISMEASSQMANVGSQIARSIGGLGRSGAFAGMRTIQQVGAAMKVGALSEEDIYNATGLMGEQGQMAFAQNQLSSSARFLQSGKGRYLLASMAGAGGKLNDRAVEEFMSGGFGVGRTRERAYQNLGQIGRADFIRNEGRLRAEVLNKVGGNVNTLALMGWAGERGIDIGAMGDRDMLFAQRMLGMGRDEMEVAVKQANSMGDMGTFMKRQGMQDDYLKDVAMARKNTGIEGVKNTFNRFREHMQSKVQQYGSRAYQDVSNMVERQLNRIFGTYESQLDKELDDSYAKFISSGGRDLGAYQNIMASRQMAGMASKYGLSGAASGRALPTYDQYRKMVQGGGAKDFLGAIGGYTGAALVGAISLGALGEWGGRKGEDLGRKAFRAMGGKTLEDMTGYHFRPTAEGGAVQDQFNQWSERMGAFSIGASQIGFAGDAETSWAAGAKKKLTTVAAADALRGTKGLDRAEAALSTLARQGDTRAKEMLQKLKSGSPEEAAQIGRQVNTLLGGSGYEGVGGRGPFSPEGAYGETAQDRYERIGSLAGAQHTQNIAGYMGGGSVRGETITDMLWGISPLVGMTKGWVKGAYGYATGSMDLGQAGKEVLVGTTGAAMGMAGMIGSAFSYSGLEDWMQKARGQSAAGQAIGSGLGGMWAGADRDVSAAIGKSLTSAETQREFLGVMGGGESSDAWMKAFREYQGMKPAEGEKDLSTDQKARKEVLRTMLASSEWKRVDKSKKPVSAEERASIAAKYGFKDWDTMSANVGGALAATSEEAGKQQVELARKYGAISRKEAQGMSATGLYDAETGRLSKGASASLGKLGLTEFGVALGFRGEATWGRAGLANVTDPMAAMEGLGRADQATIRERTIWEGMSSSRMSEAIKRLEGAKGEEGSQLRGALLPELMRRKRETTSAARATAGGRGGLAAAKWMGISLDRDTQRQMLRAGQRGDTTEMYNVLMGQGGYAGMLSDEEQTRAKEALSMIAGKSTQYSDKDPITGEMRTRRVSKDQAAAWGKEQLQSIAAKHEKERQDKQASQQDPSFRQLEKIASTLDKMFGVSKDEKMSGMKVVNTVDVNIASKAAGV